jgi:hypothetical protein
MVLTLAWPVAAAAEPDTDATLDVGTTDVPASKSKLVLLRDPAHPVREGAAAAVADHLAAIGYALEVVDHELAAAPDAVWIDRLAADLAPSQARAIAWLAAEGERLDLYVYGCETRTLGRRAIDAVAPGPAGDEAIALLIKDAAAALADGAPIGMETVRLDHPPPPRPPAPAPAPAPVPPPPAPRVHGLRIVAGYAGTSYAANVTWQNGVHVGVGWRLPFGLDLSAGDTWLPPLHAARGPSRIELRRHPFEFALGYAYQRGRLEIAGHVAALLDPVRRVATTVDPGLRALAPATRWWVALAPRLRFDVSIARWFGWWAMAGAEIWLDPVDYGVSAPTKSVVIAPRRVRPSVVTGPRARFELVRRR